MTIFTPETKPDSDVIGHYIKGDGVIWFCDSYDTSLGYWLTPVFGEVRGFSKQKPIRTNISERAIGRTFQIIHYDPQFSNPPFRYYCQYTLSPEEREFLMGVLK